MTFPELIKNSVILAPMAGVADSVFRRICKNHGADIVVSEMVSAEAIKMGAKNTAELTHLDPIERPAGIQLFGASPEKMAYAASWIADHIKPDFIDINSGCPVPKVIKKNGGSALLRDPALFKEIVSAVVKGAGTVPVTVKIRSGWQMHEWVDEEFARIVEGCGGAALTLHPRSKTMMFTGHSFWDRIEAVRKVISIPLIGNGDIVKPEHGKAMMDQTGCDAVMIGRGVYGNPWIFNQVKAVMRGEQPVYPTRAERLSEAIIHLDLFIAEYGEPLALREMKKHLSWYIHGVPKAPSYRDRIFRAMSVAEMRGVIEEIAAVDYSGTFIET